MTSTDAPSHSTGTDRQSQIDPTDIADQLESAHETLLHATAKLRELVGALEAARHVDRNDAADALESALRAANSLRTRIAEAALQLPNVVAPLSESASDFACVALQAASAIRALAATFGRAHLSRLARELAEGRIVTRNVMRRAALEGCRIAAAKEADDGLRLADADLASFPGPVLGSSWLEWFWNIVSSADDEVLRIAALLEGTWPRIHLFLSGAEALDWEPGNVSNPPSPAPPTQSISHISPPETHQPNDHPPPPAPLEFTQKSNEAAQESDACPVDFTEAGAEPVDGSAPTCTSGPRGTFANHPTTGDQGTLQPTLLEASEEAPKPTLGKSRSRIIDEIGQMGSVPIAHDPLAALIKSELKRGANSDSPSLVPNSLATLYGAPPTRESSASTSTTNPIKSQAESVIENPFTSKAEHDPIAQAIEADLDEAANDASSLANGEADLIQGDIEVISTQSASPAPPTPACELERLSSTSPPIPRAELHIPDYAQFSRTHWVDASGQVLPAPWTRDTFITNAVERLIRALRGDDWAIAMLVSRGLNSLGVLSVPRTQDLDMAFRLRARR